MEFGLTFEKLLLIGLIAALIIGPDRLPAVAEGFARVVRSGAQYMRTAKDRMREELGPEIDEVDWRKLDPRQYDPRRIIRDALIDDVTPAPASPAAAAPAASASADAAPRPVLRRPTFTREEPPPFDLEAT